MYDRWFDLIQVFEGVHGLHDYGPRFLFGKTFVLFQVKVQVVAFAVLHDCAKPWRTKQFVTNKNRLFGWEFRSEMLTSYCLFRRRRKV